MRRRLHADFGLPMQAELHASELLGKSPQHFKLDRMQRVKTRFIYWRPSASKGLSR
jgi:hypothetical protein